ncbi:hypothetical protein BO82DRAFT_355896 [Aspergillus uvarum CBS 121591]|uniref:Uncharacterized protein n=1 Tax=Aspergillus uvarum CBS 121591 TaxID=1448315 RepID=A0A319C782_9EURO|nr:hypothetical protein BO82DRAFT_355896 [Aspergillus uvarum CBS 121591]PYH79900.1 hypothetical protein BO82DRAFT_355896 [Aspergillus uvarum CBS 121591]
MGKCPAPSVMQGSGHTVGWGNLGDCHRRQLAPPTREAIVVGTWFLVFFFSFAARAGDDDVDC